MSSPADPRPVMIDAFCGAGCVAPGYAAAGWRVIGVDLIDQPLYPYEFIRADVLTVGIGALIRVTGARAVHLSPTCQFHSNLAAYQRDTIAARYPDLVTPTRQLVHELRREHGIPMVIENVPGPHMLSHAVELCGCMFTGPGTPPPMYRPRLFEPYGFELAPPRPCSKVGGRHRWRCVRNGYLPTPSSPVMSVHGGKHSRAWQRAACEAMGAPHLITPAGGDVKRGIRDVSEGVPPVYGRHCGAAMLAAVRASAAA